MINNIKTIVYHRTLCVSVPFIVLINISVKNFKRKTYPNIFLIHFGNLLNLISFAFTVGKLYLIDF